LCRKNKHKTHLDVKGFALYNTGTGRGPPGPFRARHGHVPQATGSGMVEQSTDHFRGVAAFDAHRCSAY
jgi:hypothetical protein